MEKPKAHVYDDMNNIMSRRTPQVFAAHLVPHIKPNFTILDLGCGPGSITIGLAKLVSQGYIIGVDPSQKSISEARLAAQQAGVTNISFLEGDASTLSTILSSDSKASKGGFDVIHMHQVLLYISSPISRLRDLRLLLKPGGILSTRDNAGIHRYPHDEEYQAEHAAIFHHAVKNMGGDPRAGFKNHTWFKDAGFAHQDIEYGSVAWEWHTNEERGFALAAHKGGFSKTARDQGLDKGDGAIDLDGQLKFWQEWRDNEDGRIVGLDGWVLGWKR
jgi:ubiquinone/menaquinone biosynthesis C-methylase UbiE